MVPTRCNRDSVKRNGRFTDRYMERNHNVNSGGGYCKLLEHCVCRRLSTKQQLQLPFRKAETHKENVCANKYIIAIFITIPFMV